jgi:hypothetical protein
MKKLLMILMVIIGCVSCLGHQPPPFHYVQHNGYSPLALRYIPVYVDKDFGELDKLAIDDAVRQWNFAMNGYVKLEVQSQPFDMEIDIIRKCLSGGCWMIMKIDSLNPMVGAVDPTPETRTLAWANDIGGNRVYVIRDRIQNKWMTGIMLHEMGHLLGAQHDNVYLMRPHFNWEDYRCVDYQALKLVAEAQHIPMEHLNYCVYGG